ncbi:MAG: DNA translocase FtsK 4TM domain-containing protein [Pseudomonadota bacterium]|nr:DNA translocase FtsK 4TM domain-containing protein [Pseudomonadota bacterium]
MSWSELANSNERGISERLREGAFWMIVAVAAYFFLTFITYSQLDPGWSYVGEREDIHNLGGAAGAWFASVFYSLFGIFAFLFPVMLVWSGWLILRERTVDDHMNTPLLTLRWSGFALTIIGGCGLGALHLSDFGLKLAEGAGGILGQVLESMLVNALSQTGATLMLVAIFVAGVTLFTGVSWFMVMEAVGGVVVGAYEHIVSWFGKRRELKEEKVEAQRLKEERIVSLKIDRKKAETRKPPKIEPVIQKIKRSVRVEKEKQTTLFKADPNTVLPPLSLLDEPGERVQQYSDKALEMMSRQLELKLSDFKVDVSVVAVHPGPIVTLYELELAAGTKASKVSALSKDLARSLSVISVRVVENIPGKSVIGIEIPNEHREIVYLSEILRSEVYDKSRSVMTLGMGKDIAGNPTVANLSKMPHALIAGTTGSGKSVAVNAMILSLLFKAKADEVRMIMIDPKMLELSVYEGIPHLLCPVVTDMSEAANALRWCVAEMERRYKLMSAMGVRGIAGYNKKVRDAEKAGEPLKDPLFVVDPNALLDEDAEPPEIPTLSKMPFIVVVVDEFADMIMVVGKKVEELIARLAQKARAAGIHLLLATQRPSVDVITGLIKANVPTRVAFQVSSRIDSRTILDQQGAEHLLGHGDMLYLPPGTSIPQRLHGAFVDDHEVHNVVEFLKQNGSASYVDEILQEPSEAIPGLSPEASGVDVEDSDPLFDEAVQIVTDTRRASISGVQRRLKIGYNRAARMIEEMERIGIVSPPETNGSRTVLAPPPVEG